jgi:hypothetical protein
MALDCWKNEEMHPQRCPFLICRRGRAGGPKFLFDHPAYSAPRKTFKFRVVWATGPKGPKAYKGKFDEGAWAIRKNYNENFEAPAYKRPQCDDWGLWALFEKGLKQILGEPH